MTKEECEQRGFSRPDFVLVTGDAYVDHPSFGAAIIGRVLESKGFKIAVLAQPDWRSAKDFKRFGRPRLGFLITGGNVDSMVSNYSVFKNKRKKDAYSPGGEPGKRPDRAVIVYSNRAREAYKGTAIIIGGLEASLRRFAHYDYWDNKVRRSVLIDSKADLLVYGMGEKSICEVAEALDAGIQIEHITWINGICYKKNLEDESFHTDDDTAVLPSYHEVTGDKKTYCKSFVTKQMNSGNEGDKRLVEEYDNGICVVQNPPMSPLEGLELDDVYELPFERTYHKVYDEAGGVPSIEEVEFSIIGSRGCFGSCAFCALTYHQGRNVRGRSKASIVKEAKEIAANPGFKGYIHDIGGPTANFRSPACEKQRKMGGCKHKNCMYPEVCKEMKPSHIEYLDILKAVRELAGIKKVFIRSGIRYDYILADKNSDFTEELCKYHVSGTLKVAPEHVSKNVLSAMKKPGKGTFEAFSKKFKKVNEKLGLKQYIVPYFISSHPGSTLHDAIELALYFKEMKFVPDQVQDFYPTPGTLASCMYYTGMDPFTLKPIYVPNTFEEKKMQRALLHFHKPENRKMVEMALEKAGRPELKQVLLGRTTARNKATAARTGKTDEKKVLRRKGKNEPNRKTSKNNR